MMAFLLLLVKTVGREMILNLTGGLKQMHYGSESVACRDVNVGPGTHILNNLAELDQIRGIEMFGNGRATGAAESRDCGSEFPAEYVRCCA